VRTPFTQTVYVHYVDLPPDYEDRKGLPFRKTDLTQDEALRIFGTGLDTFAANRLLYILHGRRVAGTLEDPDVQRRTAMYSQAQRDAALSFLRRTVPVDEVINAGLRAEDELEELERAMATKEDGEGMDDGGAAEKDATNAEYREEDHTRLGSKWKGRLFKGGVTASDDVYGEGVMDRIRKRNMARRAEERRRFEEEEKRREEEEEEQAKQIPGGLQKIDPSQPRQPSVQMQKWLAAGSSGLEQPPEMSRWARLWPSYLFVASLAAAVVGCSAFFEPWDVERWPFPDISPATATVGGLCLLNALVFACWKVPQLWPLMNRYFIVAPAVQRPLSILGSTISQQKPGHLAMNMLFLWLVGGPLFDEVGPSAFLQIYFLSGVTGFLASATHIVLRNKLHLTTLGASGAVYGIMAAYFTIYKFDGFKILGLPPDPYNGIQGLGFLGLLIGNDLWRVQSRSRRIDIISHFGGMAVGALYGQYFAMKKAEKAKARAEGREERSVWEVLTTKDVS